MVTADRTLYASRLIEKAGGDGPVEFVLSEESEDRYNDVILAKGWDIEAFKRNPVMLKQHDHNQPIGTWKRVRVEGKQLLGVANFDTGGVAGAEAERQVKAGVLSAVSVGFRPLSRPQERDNGGLLFEKSELLEVSLVSVPAHPNALRVKSYGPTPFANTDSPFERFYDAATRFASAVERAYWKGEISDEELKSATAALRRGKLHG